MFPFPSCRKLNVLKRQHKFFSHRYSSSHVSFIHPKVTLATIKITVEVMSARVDSGNSANGAVAVPARVQHKNLEAVLPCPSSLRLLHSQTLYNKVATLGII